MKKKNIKWLYLGILGLIPTSLVGVAVSCSTSPNNNQTITFNLKINDSSINTNVLDPANTLPTSVSVTQLYNLVFANQNEIFADAKFKDPKDLKDDVDLEILFADDNAGYLTFRLTIKQSKKQHSFKLTGFLTKSDSNVPDTPQTHPDVPSTPSPVPPQHDSSKPSAPKPPVYVPNPYDAIEGIDYFVKPGTDPKDQTNWITLPTTNNQKLIDALGTVPLPWKDDSSITIKDIEYMFDVIVGGMYTSSPDHHIEFGRRNISSNLFVATYAKWIINNWTKYGYMTFANGGFAFDIKPNGSNPDQNFINCGNNTIALQKQWYGTTVNQYSASERDKLGEELVNNTEHYVSGFWHTGFPERVGVYKTDLMQPTEDQFDYLRMLIYFFSQIRPGMSDFDKFMTAYAFTTNWYSYFINGGTPDLQGGMCGLRQHVILPFKLGGCAKFSHAM